MLLSIFGLWSLLIAVTLLCVQMTLMYISLRDMNREHKEIEEKYARDQKLADHHKGKL